MAAKRLRLAQRRKAVGFSQEALATVLRIERSTVVSWECGETDPLPRIRTAIGHLKQSLRIFDQLQLGHHAERAREALDTCLSTLRTAPGQPPNGDLLQPQWQSILEAGSAMPHSIWHAECAICHRPGRRRQGLPRSARSPL
jgi:transcriptional regulator with XRE-family HTH domain